MDQLAVLLEVRLSPASPVRDDFWSSGRSVSSSFNAIARMQHEVEYSACGICVSTEQVETSIPMDSEWLEQVDGATDLTEPSGSGQRVVLFSTLDCRSLSHLALLAWRPNAQ